MKQPGGNVTGLSDMVNVKQHLELIKEFLPNLKTVGVPYNPGEANSVSSVAALKAAAAEMGIEVIESAAPKSSDVMIATKQLVGKVDAIYCPIDNTIISAVESVIKVGIDAQIPVFAGDTDTVARGAVAAVGYNYFDLGRQTGDIVVRILKGEKAGSIDVKMAEGTDMFVNPAMAAKMGVAVPESVLQRATKVIK
jgi:putative ABC transport system substrate-binding protein